MRTDRPDSIPFICSGLVQTTETLPIIESLYLLAGFFFAGIATNLFMPLERVPHYLAGSRSVVHHLHFFSAASYVFFLSN